MSTAPSIPTPEQPASLPPTSETPPSLVNGEATPKAEEAKPAEPAKVEPLTAAALTFPEGMTADDASTGKFLEIANEHGISAEVANKLVGLQADLMKQASEAGSALWTETQKQWQDQIRADPEIGGTKMAENLSHIAKLLDTHGNPEVRQAFDITGAGNNPAIVKFLVKVGKELGESGPVSGGPASAPRDAASLLYPNQGKT